MLTTNPLRIFSQALIAMILCLCAAESQGQVICDGYNMSAVTFPDSTPFSAPATTSGSLQFNCRNTSTSSKNNPGPTYYVRVCFHIGTGANGGSNWDPRVMSNGSENLNFQIYNNSTIWGSRWASSMPGIQSALLTLPPIPYQGSVIYVPSVINYTASLSPGQTAITPGSYQNSFSGGHTEIIATATTNSQGVSCIGQSSNSNATTSPSIFPFVASAKIIKACELSPASSMNFGTVDPLSGNAYLATNSFNARCSNKTPYNIALEPSGTPTPTNGTGRLTNTNTVTSNPDTYLSYGLFRDSARSLEWGNQTGTNTYSGTGTGSFFNDPLTVYGRITNTDTRPGDYKDIVIIRVTY